jgi:hypothetical protein
MNDIELREVKTKHFEVPLGSDCSLHKNVFLKRAWIQMLTPVLFDLK